MAQVWLTTMPSRAATDSAAVSAAGSLPAERANGTRPGAHRAVPAPEIRSPGKVLGPRANRTIGVIIDATRQVFLTRGYAGTTITSGGMPIAQFLRSIQNGAGGILVDKTGLEGNYAFTLKSASRRPGVAPDPDGPPDLITALREQLGLRLQPTRVMTDYLIIEHIERPTPD